MRFSVILIVMFLLVISTMLYLKSNKSQMTENTIKISAPVIEKSLSLDSINLSKTHNKNSAQVTSPINDNPFNSKPLSKNSTQKKGVIKNTKNKTAKELKSKTHEMTLNELVSIINSELQPSDRKNDAINDLLNKIQNHSNPFEAFNTLIDIKDKVEGENRQSVLKALMPFADQGSNKAIIETFLLAQEIAPSEKFRMLTYIDPRYPLSSGTVLSLTNSYQSESSKEVQQELLTVLSSSGGDYGNSWIIENITPPTGSEDWLILVDTLGRSNSPTAFQHLHSLLNEYSAIETEETPEKQRLLAAIKQLQDNMEQQPN